MFTILSSPLQKCCFQRMDWHEISSPRSPRMILRQCVSTAQHKHLCTSCLACSKEDGMVRGRLALVFFLFFLSIVCFFLWVKETVYFSVSFVFFVDSVFPSLEAVEFHNSGSSHSLTKTAHYQAIVTLSCRLTHASVLNMKCSTVVVFFYNL